MLSVNYWLPIEPRTMYKLCVIMHSVVTEYISDMVTPVSELEGRAYLRSLGLYDVPRTRTLMASKAFSVAGPTAWNRLPQSIRDIKLASAFKCHLKRSAYINN